jgi:hypothetical protein
MGGNWDQTYENHLYTAYFKPSKWTKVDRALKVEFVYYPNNNVTLLEHTARIVEIINSDTVNNSIMEPYSQYIADRRAKEIGTGIDIAKQLLLNNVSSVEEGNSLTRNYRTSRLLWPIERFEPLTANSEGFNVFKALTEVIISLAVPQGDGWQLEDTDSYG